MWGSGKRNYPFYRRLDKSGTPRKHLTNYNYLAFKHKPTAVIRWQYVIIVCWKSGIIVIVTNTSRSLTKTLTRTDKIIHFPRSDSHTNKWIVWHSPVFWSFYEHLRSVSGHVWSACQCHWLMSHPILSQNVCLAVIVWFVNRLIDGKQDTFNIVIYNWFESLLKSQSLQNLLNIVSESVMKHWSPSRKIMQPLWWFWVVHYEYWNW